MAQKMGQQIEMIIRADIYEKFHNVSPVPFLHRSNRVEHLPGSLEASGKMSNHQLNELRIGLTLVMDGSQYEAYLNVKSATCSVPSVRRRMNWRQVPAQPFCVFQT